VGCPRSRWHHQHRAGGRHGVPHPAPLQGPADAMISHPFYWFLSTIAARSALVLLFLVAGLRLMGKRQISQMNLYDLVLVMALANGVQNAMTAGRGELSVGIVSAGTLILIGRWVTGLFVRHPRLEERLIGTPTVIIHDGQLVWDH